ncbi:MAG: DUF29 domain-containing protein [Acetobacteraceae bacterium]|nr:DUF29 domain-containing protein [Pseudomonadota bacterium]
MADGDLYETDILAWSEQQAAALRELASRRDLPNALDLAHVAEEIEDVGLSELNGVKSHIRLILGHLVKCWADTDAQSVRHWIAEIGNWQSDLADRFSPSMQQRIDLDVLWRRALRQAELDLQEQDRTDALTALRRLTSNNTCPIALDDILSEQISPTDLVDRLRAALPR